MSPNVAKCHAKIEALLMLHSVNIKLNPLKLYIKIMCDGFKVYIKVINCCFVIATCRYVHRSRVNVVAFRFVDSIIEGVDVALLPLLIITIRDITVKKQ